MKMTALSLPDVQLSIDTGELKTAIQSVLPDQSFLQGLLEETGIPAQLKQLQTSVMSLPETLENIAQAAESEIQQAWDELVEQLETLLGHLEDLPDELDAEVTEQLEDIAGDLLDHFKDNIQSDWQELPEKAREKMTQALTAGFYQFANVARQAETLFREQVQNALEESRQQLTEHVRHTLTASAEELQDAAVESLQGEILTSQTVMAMGAGVTSALGPLLPQIKAAHLAASQINELLEALGR